MNDKYRFYNETYKKYFSKMTKGEIAHLCLALIVSNNITDINGFLKDILETTLQERKKSDR